MRSTWLIASLALACFPSSISAGMLTNRDSVAVRVMARYEHVSQRHGFTWPANSRPDVRIGFPDSSPTYADLLRPLTYTFDPATIWVNPLALQLPDSVGGPRRVLQDIARTVYGDFDSKLDHEIAHHYYALELRRLTGWRRPRIKNDRYVANFIAHKIMSEGLATTVERDSIPSDTSDTWWPASVNLETRDILETPEAWEELSYEGGWRLISPLVHEYGLAATTMYIIAFPLDLPDNSVRKAVMVWRINARAYLEATRAP